MLPLLELVMEMLKFELVFSCLLCLAHSTLFAGGRIRLSKRKSHSIHITSPTTLLLARLPTRMRTVRLTQKKKSLSLEKPAPFSVFLAGFVFHLCVLSGWNVYSLPIGLRVLIEYSSLYLNSISKKRNME